MIELICCLDLLRLVVHAFFQVGYILKKVPLSLSSYVSFYTLSRRKPHFSTPTPSQVVACTGLALCALHTLSLDKAAEHCASGLRAVRMTMATSQVCGPGGHDGFVFSKRC